jgi:hypothetical protein
MEIPQETSYQAFGRTNLMRQNVRQIRALAVRCSDSVPTSSLPFSKIQNALGGR